MAEIALIVVFLAALLTVGYRYAARRGQQMSALVSRGTEVTGTVVKTLRIRRSRSDHAYRVRYAFVTSGGIEHEREINVRPKEFEQYREGQPIEIVYDPVKPEINMLKSAVLEAREALNKQHAPR